MRALAAGALVGTLCVLGLRVPPERAFAAMPWLPVLAALLVASVASLSAARRRLPPGVAATRGTRAPLAAPAWGAATRFATALLLSAAWTLLACHGAASRAIDAPLVGTDLVVEGRVVGVPRRTGRHLRFVLEIEPRGPAAGAVGSPPLAARRLELFERGGLPIGAGERWRLAVRLRPPRTLGNAGGFDRVRYLLARRIDAVGSVRALPPAERLAEGGGVHRLRERLAARLAAVAEAAGPTAEGGGGARAGEAVAGAPGTRSRDAAALVSALTLGLAERVPEARRELLRRTGTAHLLAISGLHVALVAGLGLWLARRVGGARAAPLVGVALAAAYAALAGFALPTRRALAMLAAWSLLALRRRSTPPTTTLAAALLVVLALEPLAPLSIGFWLSFGAVAALLRLHAGRVRRPGARARLAGFARTHLALGVLLLPASAWFFHSGAWIAPLANAVAVPWVSVLILPLAFVALALVWLGADTAAGWALAALGWQSDRLFDALGALERHLDGSLTLAFPSLETLALCLLGLTLLLAPRLPLPRVLAALLLAPALAANLRGARVEEGFELHVLDVGQGLAALVLTERTTWLYDTGGRAGPTGATMLERVVVPYLHALGRRRVDVIVVSHPDSDHAAGLADALARWPDAEVVLGGAVAEAPSTARRCAAGQTREVDGVRFSFLHPAAHDAGSENDLSCVLLVHHGDSRALLTGDIERAGEARLLQRLGALPVTVMTAPHHGSRSSSDETLLAALAPAHVVFPAGRDNAYGFPHPEVQMRYKRAGAETHVTGRDGATRFALGPEGLRRPPDSWRRSHRRFWHVIVEPGCPREPSSDGSGPDVPVSRPAATQTPGPSSCGKS